MESGEKPEEFHSGAEKMHNVMEVLSSILLANKPWNTDGQDDQLSTGVKRKSNLPQTVSLLPSEYMRQLLMTTEERIDLLTRVRPLPNQDVPYDLLEYTDFEVVPRIFLFQQYSPGNVYNVLLTIRNTGKASRYLKLISEIDPIFSVTYKNTSTLNTRLAPGMFSTFNVQFLPDQNRDYEYAIKFATDRESFTVPVIGIGARPILDFPDLIVVPETGVKISAVKSILVRNLGNTVAVFNTSTTSANFWLEPAKGFIEEEETVQFVVNFLSSKAGFFEDIFLLKYESGEVIRINIQGSAIDCNIRLERGSIRMQEETYIGLSTSKTLKIFNRSEYVVKYRWMRYKDSETDRAQKKEYERIFELINDAEKLRCMDLVHYNICQPKAHELICQRIYADEIASLVNEDFLYKNSHFSLVPMEGEIWPQNSVDVTVYFEPDEIGELSSTAYLEVTGREERLILSLSGVSIGPLIKLNTATIDVQNVFLCSVQTYQVVCVNKGLIPGVLVHKPKRSDFGGTVTVTPERHKLQPGQHKSFDISFTSNRNGEFVERIEFVIRESLEFVAMYIKGCIVCPTLRFNKTQLDFGTTAIGFTSRQEVMLHNDSSVPVTFGISIPKDGTESVITYEEFAGALAKPSFPSSSKEFHVSPNEGVVAANSSLKIKIDFTPNSARVEEMSLRVDMWDTDSVPMLLPILFRSKVASLIAKPEEIDIGPCFLNYSYMRSFTIENTSDIDGYFYLAPQMITDSTAVLYSFSTHQGYLEAGQSKTVSLTIITRTMGKRKATMRMLIFGEKEAKACCIINCNGQGPLVSIQPTSLDWATVLLLREQMMELTLMNKSPVPTEFKATLVSNNTSWKVFPTSGSLDPGESKNLEVTAFLKDVGKYSEKLLVTIPNSHVITVALNAIGIGSCVVCEPTIFPTFDMGMLFSHQDIGVPIVVTNHGSRYLRLIFSNTLEMKMMRGQIQAPTYDKFSVEPFSIELPAQSSGTVMCNVRSDSCGIVSEQWWLHCFYDGQGKREILGNSLFTAKFVEPSISFSKKELFFCVNMSSGVDKPRQTDELIITNTSGLDVNAHLIVDPPFGIIIDNGDEVRNLEIVLPRHEKRRIAIVFSSIPENGERHSKEYIGILELEYKEHPIADKIKCRASLNFPNVSSLPREIKFNCPLGCSVVENIFLQNNGPLAVSYKFVWLEETISIKRDSFNKEERMNKAALPTAEENQSEHTELLAETRNLLLRILSDNLVLEEPELVALEILGNNAQRLDEINQICSIVPCESIIPAYSSQCISFGFHGAEALILEARILCEIEGGPAESINVLAAADAIRFHLDRDRVDFGQQMICEPCHETIKVENRSNISLIYHIELENDESLKIRPMSATIAPHSMLELDLISRAVIPGPFEKSFKLCIKHHMPVSVFIEGTAIISQVYVSLPRSNLFKDHSVELGYQAIQSLQNWSIFPDDSEVIESGWQIVMKDETVPSVVDIEMAVESLIAKEFLQENYSFMLDRTRGQKVEIAIPYLFSPEYILEMGYVVVGQPAVASTQICNYGSRSVQVRLNKSSKVAKQGIQINFRDQTSLIPNEYTNLEVLFTPVKLKSSEKSEAVRCKFYLEVTNGFTLPIMITATVTYPFVTVNPKSLNFSEVLVGECKLLELHIKNDGLIDCQWEAKLPPNRRNQADGPFYLQNCTDIYSPGQSGSVKIYFKPHKSGYAECKLKIEINRGREPMIIDLQGKGIGHKLKIVQPLIQFPSALPHCSSEGKDFTVENIGQRTVELYWKHLEPPDLQEDRIIRVLTHYYKVNEILLPPRKPPDSSKLPSQLLEFYNSLIDEMSLSLATQRRKNEKQIDKENYLEDQTVAEEDSVSVSLTRRKKKGSNVRKLSRRITRTASITTAMSEANLPLSVLSELEVSGKWNNLPYDDPDEIETLLHGFIDELQKQPDFFEKMKDPVKEVFEALEKKKSMEQPEQSKDSSATKIKKFCMIFHGTPFTEYQAAACKASRVFEVPLLNLNNTFNEMISLGNTACSAKLREVIDTKYRELFLASEKSKSQDEDPILGIEELSTFDSLTRYEYKIGSIKSSLEKARTAPISRSTPLGGKSSAKESVKSPKTPRVKGEETFLDIDLRLFIELLEQRLSMPDMSKGFVLQSLNNDFIKKDTKTLTSILQILGEIEYPIFVAFHDSVESQKSQNSADQNHSEEELLNATFQRLLEIDEMSSSEFDLLQNADKQLYREKILLARNEEASRRRLEFQQRISDLRKQGKGQRRSVLSKETKELKRSKKSTSRVISRFGKESDKAILESSNKQNNEKTEISKAIPEKVQNVINTTDPYASDLGEIMTILQDWDPLRKSTVITSQKNTAQSKTSKNPKSKASTATASSKTVRYYDLEQTEVNEKFWIWHVKTTDPWDPKTCEMIVRQIASEKATLNTTCNTASLQDKTYLLPKIYSVVLPKNRTEPRNNIQREKAFDLFALKYDATNDSNETNEVDELEPLELIEEPLQTQLVLQPHEFRRFRVYFQPRGTQNFQNEFSLRISNSDDSYRIKVTGFGEIPCLDMNPSQVFKKIQDAKKDELNDPTFFIDTQTFDFGSLLLAGKDNKPHRKKSSLKLWNSSTMDLELEASLMTSNWKTFNIEPTKLLIKPEQFGMIDVTAGATKLGINEERLVLLVKNNPRVEVIELRSNGTKLEVELERKQISFGKVLLYREVYRNVKVRNNSTIPIFWRITPLDSVDSQIKLSSSSGRTKAQAESNVVFNYTANRIGIVENGKMNFKVYLHEKADYEEPLFTDIITVSGETYDVAVDINSANPIALGSVKVGSMASSWFTMKNRGHYDVKYVIEFEKDEKLPNEIDRNLRKNLKEDLQISPIFGVLLPDKVTTVNVNYLPKFEMRLKEAALLKCNLIDTNNDATIVAELPITVSLAAHCARFRLIPDSEISFGPTSIFSNKTLHINIENIGVFSFKYQVKNPILPVAIEESSTKKKKKEKSPRSAVTNKQGTAKSRDPVANLRIGPFTLPKIEGVIEPGDTETLAINCYPETEGRLEERILVLVEDSNPDDKHGKSVLLNVDACLPGIDFHELDAIFQDSYVVDDIQDFVCPKEIESHTVFSRKEECLYFERVNIHKTHTSSIRLFNRGNVPATVTVSLRPDVLTPKNARPDTFALDTVQESIAPMCSQIFSISFTPSLIETYNGILEAAVELPIPLKNEPHNKLSVKLSGEGCVPEVILIEPPVIKLAGNSAIGFGKCLVDEKCTKNLCFKNIGKITARVIVKIVHDLEMLYIIRAFEESNIRSLTGIWTDSGDCAYEEEEERSIVCTLHPGEIARFLVDFRPKDLGKRNAEIRLLVMDNPYENITVELEGEGFVENVVLEGLPLLETPKSGISDKINGKARKSLKHRGGSAVSITGSSITISSQSLTNAPAMIYKLDYGTCFINKMNNINFKIVNKSRERYFRFEWSSHPNLVFVPSIGHLHFSGNKDVVATFLASEPMIHKQTLLECVICEIQFPAETVNENLWDDRQSKVEWITANSDDGNENMFEEETMEKLVVPSIEPPHEIVAGTTKIIQIMLSAIVAYSDYSCAVKEINFKDTLMFQSREYKFNLENPGNVDVIFTWKIDMDAEYPTRLPESALRDAAFRPQSSRSNDSRPSSRASGGILYPEPDNRNYIHEYSRHQRGDEIVNHFKPISRDKFYAMNIEPYDCICHPTSDLFSNSANHTERSTQSWVENGDDQPFTIKPEKGVILAGETAQFTLRFSPLDVFDYKAYLSCQIENLSPNLEKLTIPITGRSLLPYCHFDVEESDYLTSGRRDSTLTFPNLGSGDSNHLPDDPNTPRVLELRIVGIGESHSKQFYLINPTTENYRFTWKDLTPRSPEDLPYFHCAHEEGIAESGKRTSIVFTFFAEDLGTFESFWRFSIDKYKLETVFLLVAIVTEPSVKCANARLKLKPTILGSKVEDSIIIVNEETFQLPFKVLPNSLSSKDGNLQTLVVSPMSGVLEAKCEQVLRLCFDPTRVGDFTFPLRCQVKKMKSSLSMLISARVRKIMPRVSYTANVNSQQMLEIHDDSETTLDFGKLTLNQLSTMKFEIANIGDVALYYTWDLGIENCGTYILTISGRAEYVSSDSKITCYLELMALEKTVVRQHPVFLKFNNGPIYRMFVKAFAKHPSIEFSFVKYNFGPCYVRDENSSAYVAQLFLTNNDKTPAIVECNFVQNLPHMTVNLEALSEAIPGHSTVTIPINFRPLVYLRYHENLIFLINDSSIQQTVSLKGEGIPYKISLENLRDKSIEFGNVPVGKSITRKVRILNAGRAAVELCFDLVKSLPGSGEHRRRLNICQEESFPRSKIKSFEDSKFNDITVQDEIFTILREILDVQPRNIVLAANKSVELVVKFKPTKRMTTFVEKIGAQADSTILPLFFVRGSCVDREFRLSRTQLYFGTIVEGCSTEMKLVLHNSGDFGARFKWNTAKLKPNFDLKPISGYCSPGMDFIFNVSFDPIKLASILQAEATIEIEKYMTLKVSCSGGCCKIPDSMEVLRFLVPVRSMQSKNLTIKNDTSFPWNVETVLTGEFFCTEEKFTVPGNKSYSCSLTYTPLVMNNDQHPHQGRLLVKLPDNKPPLVYTLLGVSLPPEVLGKIVRQLPAKTKYTELLPVHNWLNKSQSFSCDIKLVKDQKADPVLHSFTGNGRLDVPANGSRDFRAFFYCYKETTLNFQIKFTNDEGEYQYYEVQYKVSKPEVLSTIRLTTAARSKTCYLLQIDNPLDDRSVTFNANCQHRDISIQEVPKVVSAKTSDKIPIEYSPLIPGESVAKFDINCPELGNFPYELRLKATPAAAEKVIRVTAMLGSSTNFPIIINNISKKSIDFDITIDNPSFICRKTITVAPQKESNLEVTYEPCDAKNVTATLRATSETLGEMLFPLIGSYSLPKPQGPFTISRNSSISIVFKNIFSTTKPFEYRIDGDAFSTATSSETIKSKQSSTIIVKFRTSADSSEGYHGKNYPVAGKLIVSCVEPTVSQIIWVYYLRGVTE